VPAASGNVPGAAGDTGTSRGAGSTSELLGLGFGTIGAGMGGGICAKAPLAERSRIVNATTSALVIAPRRLPSILV
jgi:hypothetical protein